MTRMGGSSDQDLGEDDYLQDAGEGIKDGDAGCSSKMASCDKGDRFCGGSGRVCPDPNWGWLPEGENWGWNEGPPVRYAAPVNWPPEVPLVPVPPVAWEDMHAPSGNLSWGWGVDREALITRTPLGLGENGASPRRVLQWGKGNCRSTGWGDSPEREYPSPVTLSRDARESVMSVAGSIREESPVYTLLDGENDLVWSGSNMDNYVRKVLSIMRMIVNIPQHVSLGVITRVDEKVCGILFNLARSLRRNSWLTAEVASRGVYARGYLMSEGSPLVSLLDLARLSGDLKGYQRGSPVSTGLTLSEEEEDLEPDMMDEDEEVQECPASGSSCDGGGGPVG
jgi:hypothetical protein